MRVNLLAIEYPFYSRVLTHINSCKAASGSSTFTPGQMLFGLFYVPVLITIQIVGHRALQMEHNGHLTFSTWGAHSNLGILGSISFDSVHMDFVVILEVNKQAEGILGLN